MHAIEAANLCKTFRGVRAVDNLSLTVDAGDIVGILGPNGAGKTTTLMMLLGITEPDAGSVRLLGRELPRHRSAALTETNFTASYVNLPDRMKVREILEVYGEIYGAAKHRVDDVVDLFDIGHLLARYTSQLSSGQKTLIGLAKSLMNAPRLLVLDEPTASLDPEIAAGVRDVLLRTHAEQPFAILITSHNMLEIERLCRRVVFVAHGRIVADGSPAEVAASYAAAGLEETFLTIAQEVRR